MPRRAQYNWKEIASLVVTVGGLACVPLEIAGLRARNYVGKSAPELTVPVKADTKEQVKLALMPVDEIDTTDTAIGGRWNVLSQEMADSGVEDAAGILETARHRFSPRTWPVTWRNGYLGDEQVYIVISGWNSPPSYSMQCVCSGPACGFQSVAIDTSEKNTEVALITAEAPHRLLGYQGNYKPPG